MAEAIAEHTHSAEVSLESETGNAANVAGETDSGNTAGSERKRTRGARAKRAAEVISETPQVEPQTIKPDKRKTRRNPTARKKDREVGSENAAIILSLLDGLAVTVLGDRKSTRLNSSHVKISYAVFCLKKKKSTKRRRNQKHR